MQKYVYIKYVYNHMYTHVYLFRVHLHGNICSTEYHFDSNDLEVRQGDSICFLVTSSVASKLTLPLRLH